MEVEIEVFDTEVENFGRYVSLSLNSPSILSQEPAKKQNFLESMDFGPGGRNEQL